MGLGRWLHGWAHEILGVATRLWLVESRELLGLASVAAPHWRRPCLKKYVHTCTQRPHICIHHATHTLHTYIQARESLLTTKMYYPRMQEASFLFNPQAHVQARPAATHQRRSHGFEMCQCSDERLLWSQAEVTSLLYSHTLWKVHKIFLSKLKTAPISDGLGFGKINWNKFY